MRLYLIRHAVTAETGSVLSGRTAGIPLSSSGRSMAQRLAEELADTDIRAFYTSPVQRCRETAAIAAAPHGLRPASRPAFIEVDYGDWTGRRLSRLRRLKAWDSLVSVPSRFTFPGGGESLDEAQHRVVRGIEALAADHRDDPVAVVTHNDAIRLAVCHHLGMPLDLFHRLRIGPASVTVIDLEPDVAPRVVAVNVHPLRESVS